MVIIQLIVVKTLKMVRITNLIKGVTIKSQMILLGKETRIHKDVQRLVQMEKRQVSMKKSKKMLKPIQP